jgi:hypothetical protein
MCNMGPETEHFFLIVTFLGWTRLHATYIKPEVVATKKYTGYLHYGSSRLDPGLYEVRLSPGTLVRQMLYFFES